ncbi:hypothetical protein PSCICM_06220 [Pseudomonas cichorii]|uniref:hypothetical protein n=1 Tax=Pseudomonas cichorii TaxID=36746 RepID=UPI00190FD72A|nr:hypothetical protein [Pseudomonas cichorii]GFM74803.1 hypothetical protein PSCICM_06220 [Pseudomonas cichorii]
METKADFFNRIGQFLSFVKGRSPSKPAGRIPYRLERTPGVRKLAGYAQATTDSVEIAVRRGGDWDQDGKSKDERFLDLVHFELC